jgi:uncharacterized repeat protein (TIGR04076 family)
MLKIEVCEVKGKCPVYKVGDQIIIDDPKIVLNQTDALCTHALSSLLHYTLALEEGVNPVKLGLSKPGDEEHAYIQYMDPGKPYTNGGTVIFKCKRIEKKKHRRKD